MSIPDRRRVVITGMAINTPLGDTLDGFRDALLAGRSAITHWKAFDASRIYSKVGGDLTDYDPAPKLASFSGRTPELVLRRLHRLLARVPWSTKLSMLLAVDAGTDAAVGAFDPQRVAVLIAGHNLNSRYQFDSQPQFVEEPDYIDPLFTLHGLDTDHGASISEVLGLRGPLYTVGAACATGNAALRCALDEIRHHGMEAALVTGAILDFSPMDLHGMALMGAISFQGFNEAPAQASRPYDVRREGFVPAHGGAAVVLENLASARSRGVPIYAELVGVESTSDACHLPQPSEDGQALAMSRLLEVCGVAPEAITYVNAHATSTPLGDLTELRSIKRVFGRHAGQVKLNATKSMLGHTCWAAPLVETVATVLQMQAGRLHPSINIDELDPEVDLDVCAGRAVDHTFEYALKNSFGFGGINSVSLLRRL
ncbi:MAG: 3-oxoacyl-[acyl-carrier-protein] synthase [Chthoniobacter sp.]|nr:3-oxoacyl-[acyl-carrier-protein] synthase [Chthoniobacter sp.]